MSRALAVLGTIATLLGGILLFARAELFDPGSLGAHAADALGDEDVRVALSPTIAEAIGDATPENQPTEAEVAEALENPRVAGAFEVASGAVARQLSRSGGGAVELDLAEVTAVAVSVTEGASQDELGISASDYESAGLEPISGRIVVDALELAERAGWIGLILAPLGALALILSVLTSRDRLRALAFACLSIAAGAVLLAAMLYVGREIVLAQFDDELTQDAVSAAWNALLGGLSTAALVTAGATLAAAIVAGLAASRRRPGY